MPRKKTADKEPVIRAIEEIELELKKNIPNPWMVKAKYRALGFLKDELFKICQSELPNAQDGLKFAEPKDRTHADQHRP